jgi:Protein of unknown function (DUF2778)
MTWAWDESAGELSHDGRFVGKGYSGNGRGKNNPSMRGVAGVGPIPVGKWRIVEKYDSHNVGPYALTLHAVDATPDDDTHDATGRGSFRIHGDSIRAPGTASKGCIILPRNLRQRIWESGDRDMVVIT